MHQHYCNGGTEASPMMNDRHWVFGTANSKALSSSTAVTENKARTTTWTGLSAIIGRSSSLTRCSSMGLLGSPAPSMSGHPLRPPMVANCHRDQCQPSGRAVQPAQQGQCTHPRYCSNNEGSGGACCIGNPADQTDSKVWPRLEQRHDLQGFHQPQNDPGVSCKNAGRRHAINIVI